MSRCERFAQEGSYSWRLSLGFQCWTTEAFEGQAESPTVSFWIYALSPTENISRSGVREDHTASYFSHNNTEATQLREKLAEDSLEMLIQWLKDGGNVGIHGEDYTCFVTWPIAHLLRLDATNSTRARR